MKVVTLKSIREVPAPGAAEPTDGYAGPVHRTRQTIIEPGESANFNCSIVNFSQGCNTGWHIHDCDQILIVTPGIGWVATETEPGVGSLRARPVASTTVAGNDQAADETV